MFPRLVALAVGVVAACAVAGTTAVTARADTEHSNLYVLGLSSSKPHRIPTATDPYAFALDPSWRADGKRIAFTYGVCDDCPGDIVTIDLKGRHRREFSAAVGSRPVWAPDGRSITYVTTGQSIASINLANGRTSPLLDAGRHPLDNPAWSPDGTRLAFSRQVAPDNWDIFVYAPATGRTKRLVHAPHSDVEPAWSRDGRHIAYVTQLPNLRFAISVIRPNGTGNHILTRGPRRGRESVLVAGRADVVVRRVPAGQARVALGHQGERLAGPPADPPDLTVISAAFAPRGDRIVFSARDSDASS